jgi:hypothetical protein
MTTHHSQIGLSLETVQADRAARVSRRTRQNRVPGDSWNMDRFEIVDSGTSWTAFFRTGSQVTGREPKNLTGSSKALTRSSCCELVEDRLTGAALNRKEMMLTLSSLIVY